MALNETELAARWAAVRARIEAAAQAAGRDPAGVGLVAVSKQQPPEAVAALAALGQRVFGESYVQEAARRREALGPLADCLEWHFIGPLQSNKTRHVAAHYAWVHSVDRLRIARRLSEQRPEHLPPLQITLQVNVSGEASKAGVAPADLPALAEAVVALPRLRLRGLMTLPARCHDPEAQRRPFAQLRCLRDALATRLGQPLDTLSMGMSGDLEAAVAEGATWVRVGTALFGPRPGAQGR